MVPLLWVFAACSLLPCSAQPSSIDCSEMTYENRNQTDYGPLVVSRVSGTANDNGGVAVPGICIGVFTTEDHRLVASVRTDAQGRFEIKGVSRGDYRLVAKCEGFCSGNAKIRVVSSSRSKKRLQVKMRFAGIDTCSFFEVK